MTSGLLFNAAAGPATTTAAEMQRQLRFELGVERSLRPDRGVAVDQGLLVVLQAVNAGGKDGTIAEVISALGVSQRIRVERFAKRESGLSAEEAIEWASNLAPHGGELVFYNRSYYEAMLGAVLENDIELARIRNAILEFERSLANRRTVLLKMFLHIDRDEQLRRLDRRRDVAGLQVLHNAHDYLDQELWADIMVAYHTVLLATHSSAHPWFVIPANERAVRNSAVASLLEPHLPTRSLLRLRIADLSAGEMPKLRPDALRVGRPTGG